MAKSFGTCKPDNRCTKTFKVNFTEITRDEYNKLKAEGFTPIYIQHENGSLFCVTNYKFKVLQELGLRKGYSGQQVNLAA